MAKPHRKTTEEPSTSTQSAVDALGPARPAKAGLSLHVGACGEAATALAEWEGEGGAPADASGHAAPTPAAPKRLLLERLGAALVGEWNNLPSPLQRVLYERAVGGDSPSNRLTVRRDLARFLHDHKSRGDRR
jgi:hypothetical protein